MVCFGPIFGRSFLKVLPLAEALALSADRVTAGRGLFRDLIPFRLAAWLGGDFEGVASRGPKHHCRIAPSAWRGWSFPDPRKLCWAWIR